MWPLVCSCGVRLRESGEWVQTPQNARPERHQPKMSSQSRDESLVAVLVAICQGCSYFRQHDLVGGRCTHRNCQCGRGTDAIEIGGVRINEGLVDRMRRGATCPDGRWASLD